MPLETAFIPTEERLDLTVYGRLDLSLTQDVTDLLQEPPRSLRTCVIDLTQVEQSFASGLALLRLLDERLSRRGVWILVLTDDQHLLQQLPMAMHHASLKRVQGVAGAFPYLEKAAPDPVAHCRVLVVDDNPDVAEAQQMLLTALNAEVRIAHSGAEALRIVADWSPTLVLMDIGMPGMDGYEVARRLRSEQAERAFRLVAITGWGQDEDRRKAQEAGFDQLLLKPVGAAELKAVLATTA